MNQELFKQAVTIIKTVLSPVNSITSILVTLQIVFLGQRVFVMCLSSKPKCLIESLHTARSLATKLLLACICVCGSLVCVRLAGGTTLSAFGGLPSDHLRVHSALIKDKMISSRFHL